MNGIYTENHTLKLAIFIVNVTNVHISPLKVDAIVEKLVFCSIIHIGIE